MRILLNLLFWSAVASLFYGFYYRMAIDYATGEKIIVFSVLGLTFIYLPLFLVHRWKGKKLSDYTLTDENFQKMRNKRSEKTENQ